MTRPAAHCHPPDRRRTGPAATATAVACAAGWCPTEVPLARSRAEQFDDLVLDAVEDLERRWERELAGVEFAVEDVPWVEHTSPDEVVLDADVLDDGSVPLARVLPAHREDGRERTAADRRLPASAGDPRARPRGPRRPRARRRRRPGRGPARPRPGGDRPHRLTGRPREPPASDAAWDADARWTIPGSGAVAGARRRPRRSRWCVAGRAGRRRCALPAARPPLRRPAGPRPDARPVATTTCPASSSSRRARHGRGTAAGLGDAPRPRPGRPRRAPAAAPRAGAPRLPPSVRRRWPVAALLLLAVIAAVAVAAARRPARQPAPRRGPHGGAAGTAGTGSRPG